MRVCFGRQPVRRIDAAGNRQVQEADVCGTAGDEALFDPAYLVTHNDPRVIYAQPTPAGGPDELPPDPHKLQLVVERVLNQLLDLAAPEAGEGKLHVESAFDPGAADLRVTGRGVQLTHTTISLGRLAALAHRAGFTFVCHRHDPGVVYASCAVGDYIEILASPAPGADGMDVLQGNTLQLTVRPALPADTTYRWLTIACGAGRAVFSGGRTAPAVTLQATAPGALTVKIDATRRRRTVSAIRTLRVGLKDLANNTAISSDGTLSVNETVAGPVDRFFHAAFLVRHNDTRATYGTDPNNHLMQAAVAKRLNRLLDLMASSCTGHWVPAGRRMRA